MFSQFVMNKKDGKTYRVTGNKIQSQNRIQVTGTTCKNVRHAQVAQSSLLPMTEFEGYLCMCAEKIIRCKKAMDETEHTIVQLYRILKKQVMA